MFRPLRVEPSSFYTVDFITAMNDDATIPSCFSCSYSALSPTLDVKCICEWRLPSLESHTHADRVDHTSLRTLGSGTGCNFGLVPAGKNSVCSLCERNR